MRKLSVLSCKFAMAALAVLLSASALATTLARQSGAFGIITYDLPPVTETQTTPEVTEQNKAGFRFFKVTVELP